MSLLSFLNNRCLICNDSLANPNSCICIGCLGLLPWMDNYCSRCAHPLPLGNQLCGSCLQATNLVPIQIIVPFYYATPVDNLIVALKFGNNLTNAKLLGTLMAEHLLNFYTYHPKPDCLMPVPLHSRRLRERGYNQALELAKPIVAQLNIPLDRFSLIRIKPTQAQTKLKAKERHTNIKGAFSLAGKITLKHVALIDDVITTGSTINELIKLLGQHGVKKIDIWCCAKSLLGTK